MGPFVREHGSDVARITILFAAPPENNMEWSDEGVGGATRFLNRVVALFGADHAAIAAMRAAHGDARLEQLANAGDGLVEEGAILRRRLHATIKKVTQDTERFGFNTALAALMELLNDATRYRAVLAEPDALFVWTGWCFARLLAPFAPHLAEELHGWFGGAGTVYDAGWPAWDEAALVSDSIEIVLQVNGKVRDRAVVPRDADEAALRACALDSGKVREAMAGKPVRKLIVVPGRIVNVVV